MARISVLFCSPLLHSDETVFAEALIHFLGAATGCAMALMAAEALALLLRDRRTNGGQRLEEVWGSLMAVVEGMLAAEPRSGSRDRHRTEEGPRRQGGEVETLVAYQSSLALASAEAGRHQQLPPSEMMRQRQELRQQLLALRRQLDNLSGGDASPQKRRGEMSAREAFGSPTPAEETWGLAVQEAGEHRMEVRPGGLRTGPGTESSCRQDVAPLTISQGLHTWDPVHEGRGSIVFDGEVIVQGQPMRVVSIVKRNPGSDGSDYTFEEKVCAPLNCSPCRSYDRIDFTVMPSSTMRCMQVLPCLQPEAEAAGLPSSSLLLLDHAQLAWKPSSTMHGGDQERAEVEGTRDSLVRGMNMTLLRASAGKQLLALQSRSATNQR